MRYTVIKVEQYRAKTGTPISFITLRDENKKEIRVKIWRKVSPVVLGHLIEANIKPDKYGEAIFEGNTFSFADGSTFDPFLPDDNIKVHLTPDGKIEGLQYSNGLKLADIDVCVNRRVAIDCATRILGGMFKIVSDRELPKVISYTLTITKVFEDYLSGKILYEDIPIEVLEREAIMKEDKIDGENKSLAK
jgi:hypothetical protein